MTLDYRLWMFVGMIGILFIVAGCAAPLERAEELGAAVLQAKEDASALVVKGCRRYVCRTGRIGAVSDEFATPAELIGWSMVCAKKTAAAASSE